MAADKQIVLVHGTSSTHLQAILDTGLSGTPPQRLSEILCDDEGEKKHLVSMPGTYLASQVHVAEAYARKAVVHFGGDPLLLVVSLPASALVPDEDEVHCQLSRTLIDAFAPDQSDDETALPFAADLIDGQAVDLAKDLYLRFERDDTAGIDDVASSLSAMLKATMLRSGDSGPDEVFFESSWSDPSWVNILASDQEGLELYRAHMDALCRAMAGMDPDAFPCGWEINSRPLIR